MGVASFNQFSHHAHLVASVLFLHVSLVADVHQHLYFVFFFVYAAASGHWLDDESLPLVVQFGLHVLLRVL